MILAALPRRSPGKKQITKKCGDHAAHKRAVEDRQGMRLVLGCCAMFWLMTGANALFHAFTALVSGWFGPAFSPFG